MIEPWPGTKTLVIWTVSATIAGIVYVIAWVTRDERLLLDASGGFLAAVISELIHEPTMRYFRRASQNLLYLPNANKAASCNNRGDLHDRQGDVESAIRDYTEALHLNPRYIEALINRGRCLSKKGDCEKAIADLSEAIRLDPNNAQAHFHRGICCSKQRDYQNAVADFSQVLRLRPNHAQAYAARERAESKLPISS